MKTLSLASLAALAILLTSSMMLVTEANAAVITLQDGVSPTSGYSGESSTFIRSDNPTTNYNAYLDSTIITGNTASGADIRGLFSFDLSVLPSGATINSVTFILTAVSNDSTSGASPLQLDILPLATAFTAGGATWNTYNGTNAWTTPGGDYSSSPLSTVMLTPNAIVAGNTATFASTTSFVSFVQGAYNSSTLAQFILKLDNETGTTRDIFFFGGDAAPNSSYRPSLTINYTTVPEPSVTAMIGVGAMLVLLHRSKRRGRLADRAI